LSPNEISKVIENFQWKGEDTTMQSPGTDVQSDIESDQDEYEFNTKPKTDPHSKRGETECVDISNSKSVVEINR
jgi:hypothetical protein